MNFDEIYCIIRTKILLLHTCGKLPQTLDTLGNYIPHISLRSLAPKMECDTIGRQFGTHPCLTQLKHSPGLIYCLKLPLARGLSLQSASCTAVTPVPLFPLSRDIRPLPTKYVLFCSDLDLPRYLHRAKL